MKSYIIQKAPIALYTSEYSLNKDKLRLANSASSQYSKQVILYTYESIRLTKKIFRKSSSYPFFIKIGKNESKGYYEFYCGITGKKQFSFNIYESIRLGI